MVSQQPKGQPMKDEEYYPVPVIPYEEGEKNRSYAIYCGRGKKKNGAIYCATTDF